MNQEKINELRARKEKIHLGGGQKAIDKQHAKGKMTARERIAALVDPGSFLELEVFTKHRCHVQGMEKKETPGEGVVIGAATINGRPVYVYSQDFTVMGGAVGEMNGLKIANVQEKAMANGVPLIGIIDSAGGRMQEGVNSAKGYGSIFKNNARASGSIPQFSVIMGPCAGGACYSPALTDFIFMVSGMSQMFLTGPASIKTATGEVIDQESLGGAYTHNAVSGVAHFMETSEQACFEKVRKVLSYMPQCWKEKPPVVPTTDDPEREVPELTDLVPDDNRVPYDMKELIRAIADNGEFTEVQELFADNIIVGFIRLDGHSVGVIASQPLSMGGCLDIDASDKAARFVRCCDCYNIPLLTINDVPGFLPGTDQEYKGIIRHGAKMLFAYAEATVPKVTLIVRKSYGGSQNAMCDKHDGADIVFSWPTAEIAVMGAAGAVNVMYKAELAAITDPEEREAFRKDKIREYEGNYLTPYTSASYGYTDDVLEPKDTRKELIKAFRALENKEELRFGRKHGNIPL